MDASFDYVRRIIPATETTFSLPVAVPWWLTDALVDLYFTQSLYYDASAGGAGQAVTTYLTCSRASTGYANTAAGTLTSFAVNTLRITDAGLLCEGARTNGAIQSQDLSNASWTKTNSSIGSTTTAPDGTNTAQKLVEAAGNAEHYATFTQAGVGNPLTTSVYAKADTRSWLALTDSTRTVGIGNFNLATGVIGTTTGLISSSIEALANGWYRCSVVGNFAAVRCQLGDADTGTGATYSYTGDGTSGLFLWGAQNESTSTFASSYIPTTTVSVARAADAINCASTLLTVFAATPQSVVTDIKFEGIPQSGAFPRIIGESAAGDEDLLQGNSLSNTVISIWNNATALDATLGGSLTLTGGVKIASAQQVTPGFARSAVGGNGTVATDTNGPVVPSAPTIGRGSGGGNEVFAYYRRLTAWNSKLADATLKAFTVP